MDNKILLKRSQTIKVDRELKESKTIRDAESHRNATKLKELAKLKQSLAIDPTIYGFGIDPFSLENIVTNYKDRVLYNNNNIVKEYPDLLFFEKQEGTQTLIDSLQTDIERGIKNKEKSEKVFGSNKSYLENLPPFSLYLLEAFEDPMVQLLIVCAIISIALGGTLSDDPNKDWIDGLSMIIAVFIVVMIGSVTRYQEKKQFFDLNKIQAKYKVIRMGNIKELLSDEILVGDLILINYGEIIPVDILLIEGNEIKMDESVLTGETFPAKKEIFEKCEELKKKGNKNIPSPLILSGTKCIQGNGKGIVLCVGSHSQKNLYKTSLDTDKDDDIQSPLNDNLENISRKIAIFGLISGTIIFISLFIRFGIEFQQNMKAYKKHFYLKVLMKSFLFNFPYKKNNANIQSVAIQDNVTNPKYLIAKKILDIILLSISIFIIAIPEGLSSAINLSFAFSLKKLVKHNNLIRKIEACEKMGCANYLCIDKTGIITTNEMSVSKIIIGNNEIKDLENIMNTNDSKEIKNPLDFFNNKEYWKTLKLAISLNLECQIHVLDKDDMDGNLEKCESWNKTDKSLIDFLHKFGVSISYYNEKYLSDVKNYKLFKFNQKTKRMTSCIHHEKFPTKYRLFTKGASEKFSRYCTSYMNPNNGVIEKIDDEFKNNINNTLTEFNKEKMRTIYIAYKDITEKEFENCENDNKNGQYIEENNLTFLAIIIIKDPIEKEVKEAIQTCKNSFINVIMVTGENMMTSASIAKDCGILNENFDINNLLPNDMEYNPELMYDDFKKEDYIDKILIDQPKIITGNTFYEIIGGIYCKECNKDINSCGCPKTDEEARQLAESQVENDSDDKICDIRNEQIRDIKNFEKLLRNLKVIARAEPIHKYALVLGLKTLKNIVAVTGKSTNDAPTLEIGDIGISMLSGTDVAKRASDIILTDNNFSSIMATIIFGRNISENVRKFLQFQLTINFSSCFSVFICAVFGNETPLTPIQLLWINLIMDSFGALSLATEPPYIAILKVKPKKSNETLITSKMLKHIFLQTIILFTLMVLLYICGPKFIPEENLVKIAENRIIKYCYGKIPGAGNNHGLIISGAKIYWPSDVYLKGNINKNYCGNYASRQNLNLAFKEYININCSTSHMTIIFNVFVFYSLFNQINCRILDDSLNIFKHITKSYLFLIIIVFEIIVQIMIISFGNTVFHVSFMGLTWKQWLISFGFSAITFLVSIIAKFINLDKHIEKCLKPFEEEEIYLEEDKDHEINKIDSEMSTFEKNFRLDETNIYNEHNKKDNVDLLKMSDFTQDNQNVSNKEKNEVL